MTAAPHLAQYAGWDILVAGDMVRLRDPDTGLMLSVVGDQSDAAETQVTTSILRKFVTMVAQDLIPALPLTHTTELHHLAGIAERLEVENPVQLAAAVHDEAANARLLEILEDSYGLHSSLDILYVVDGYQITRTLDDEPVGDTVHGTSLAAALAQLAHIPVPRRGDNSARGHVVDERVLLEPGRMLQEIHAFLRAHKQPQWADLIDRLGPQGITERIEQRAAALLAAQAANGLWVELKDQLTQAEAKIADLRAELAARGGQ